MIIVDKALQERENNRNPIRVGMIGAGFMGQGIAVQIINSTPGMVLAAIGNRTLAKAKKAYNLAGIDDVREVSKVWEIENNISGGIYSITENPDIICEAENIDAIIEVTGTIEESARIIIKAIAHGKHVILMNAEVDGTIGPILKKKAD